VTAPFSTPKQDAPESWLTALARVMARVTANADREGVLNALTAGVVEEFGVALSRLWLYDPTDDGLHLRASAGMAGEPQGSVARIALADERAPVARAVRHRDVVVIDELGPDSGIVDPSWVESARLRAYAGFPLLVGDRVCGAMVVFQRAPWPPLMLDALGVLARQAALALEHARLIEESHTLQTIAAELASARRMGALLEGIAERTMVVVGADGCAVWLVDDDGALRSHAASGLSHTFLSALGVSPQRRTGGLFEEIRRTRKPLFSRHDPAAAREVDTGLADALTAEGIVSALRLPLFEPGGEVAGMLALYHRRERLYSDSEVRLAQAFADQIAVALHNTRLTEKEREARRTAARQVDRLTAFAGITEQLLATPNLESVLRVVVEAASQLSDASGAMLGLIDDERRQITAVAADGEPRSFFEHFKPPLLDEEYLTRTATGQAITRRETVVVEDYLNWPTPHGRQEEILAEGVRAFIVAPLVVEGEVSGVLWVNDTRARSFAPEDVGLVQALADQAALAIAHARLVRRGQDAAVLEERARLARDLHDSVTQSVFSLGMMARAAQTQHARGADGLGATLERIGTLAQEALAEMRALLFELRPAALAEEGLAVALERLAAAMRVRADVPVTFDGVSGARPAPETETAIFRIVQEALGNAVKHARATSIAVTLSESDGRLTVTVSDDGVGFEPGATVSPSADGRSGGLGMATMRERAAAAGLDLRVFSTLGEGTTVRVEANALQGA
jgi:signal transduction histidine kinase